MRVGIYSQKLCFYELFILTIMNIIFDVMHMYAGRDGCWGEGELQQHATEGGGTSLDVICCWSII